jgi:hypothetical protein
MAHGFDILKSVMNGYITSTTPQTNVVGKNPSEHNAKYMNFALRAVYQNPNLSR